MPLTGIDTCPARKFINFGEFLLIEEFCNGHLALTLLTFRSVRWATWKPARTGRIRVANAYAVTEFVPFETTHEWLTGIPNRVQAPTHHGSGIGESTIAVTSQSIAQS